MVGADEIAVNLFLSGQIGFNDIAALVEETLNNCSLSEPGSLDDAIECLNNARIKAREISKKFSR